MKNVNGWVAGCCAALVGIGAMLNTNAFAAAPVTKAENDDARANAEREKKLDEARKRLDEAAREVAELSRALSEDAMPRVARIMGRQMSRAMLGVNIGSGREDDKRQDGVQIISVSPGGAAAEAGLKAGDLLVEIQGKSLQKEGDESPREKLLAAMKEVEPDEKVSVRYVRNGKAAAATLTARRTDRMITMPFMPGPEAGEFPSFAFMRSHGVFGSAELVALTPKLGQYFGTDKGLLVVRAPADSRLKLEEGDVIVDIDGRVPTSASHALRILGSYQAGEKLKLNVFRQKKRVSFEIAIPDDVLRHRPEAGAFSMPHDAPPPAPVPAIPAVSPAPLLDDLA